MKKKRNNTERQRRRRRTVDWPPSAPQFVTTTPLPLPSASTTMSHYKSASRSCSLPALFTGPDNTGADQNG